MTSVTSLHLNILVSDVIEDINISTNKVNPSGQTSERTQIKAPLDQSAKGWKKKSLHKSGEGGSDNPSGQNDEREESSTEERDKKVKTEKEKDHQAR